MSPREFRVLRGELHRFRDLLRDIRKAIAKKQRGAVIAGFNNALLKDLFLSASLEEIRVTNEYSGFFRRIGFFNRKRRLIKFIRVTERALKKSFMLFCADRNARALKWLDFAVSNVKDGLRVLDKLNTESNTAKSVQIQIQKGKLKM